MRIEFSEITIKNFFSYGAKPTTLKLNTSPLNLISGVNGRGKSSLLVDALFFALFGKPFRSVKIKSIVNDINKKNCVVDLKFTVNNKSSRIIRGLNPDFIEFYHGEDKIDSRSSKKLMQKEIDNLIQLNPDTLKNICILSANQSKSFLDLLPHESRKVIENILGIYVYSLMLQEVNNKRLIYKEKFKQVEKDINFYIGIIKESENNISRMKLLRERFEKERIEKIEILKNSLAEKEESILTFQSDLVSLEKLGDIINEKRTDSSGLEKIITENRIKVKHLLDNLKDDRSKIEILGTNTTCPLCSSDLSAEHKELELSRLNNSIADKKKSIETILIQTKDSESNLADLRIEILELEKEITHRNELTTEIKITENDISAIKSNIKSLEEDTLERHLSNVLDKEKIQEYIDKYKAMKEEYNSLSEELLYCDYIKDVLSDEGVRSLVIKKELPFLNSRINEYLRRLGFGINIEFDELFSLIITNPRKKDYEYNNFSNGQKKRIDLAILMSFLDLARRKNSINTNLLIFDEVLDSSLDADGIADFIVLLNRGFEEGRYKNVFIISHKKELSLADCRKIEVLQDGEFSYLKED